MIGGRPSPKPASLSSRDGDATSGARMSGGVPPPPAGGAGTYATPAGERSVAMRRASPPSTAPIR